MDDAVLHDRVRGQRPLRAAAFSVSLNVQACASLDTFAEEIVDRVAFRVFGRSRSHEQVEKLVAVAPPVLSPARPR
jgi:hypothetical protein